MNKVELIAALAGWPDDATVVIAIEYPRYWSIEDVGPIVDNNGYIQVNVTASPGVINLLIKEGKPCHEHATAGPNPNTVDSLDEPPQNEGCPGAVPSDPDYDHDFPF